MRTALFIGGRSDYTGPAVRILPRTRARVYLSERWKENDLINNDDRQQQLIHLTLLRPSNRASSSCARIVSETSYCESSNLGHQDHL